MALAIAASLLIGAAGAYGYMRYAQAQEQTDIGALRQERDKLMEQAKRQSEELDKLTLRLMAMDGNASGAKEAESAERKRLQEKLASVLEENDRLGDRLTEANAHSAAADQTILDLRRKIADMQADGASAQSRAADERDRLKNEDIPRLKAEIARAQDEIAGLTADLSTARGEAKRQESEADALRRQLDEASRRVRETEAARQQLQAALDAAGTGGETADAPPPSTEDGVAPARKTRGEADVETALARTPGLGRLTAEKRDALKRQLVSGACVAAALEDAFGRVPVITLRNMIRDLDSDC